METRDAIAMLAPSAPGGTLIGENYRQSRFLGNGALSAIFAAEDIVIKEFAQNIE